MSTTMRADLPDALLQQGERFVQSGRAGNTQELLTESLRRYLESYQETLMEQMILDDATWGLHGDH